MYLPILNDWRLNERHYGALTGLNKAETTAKHGEALVTQWRRSYDIPPPPMDASHEHWPGKDRRYAGLDRSVLPATESLATTGDRVLPFWHSTLVPQIQAGKRLLSEWVRRRARGRRPPLCATRSAPSPPPPAVVAHGNSLRALVKHLDGISRDEITGLNIPTGVVRARRNGEGICAVPPREAMSAPARPLAAPRLRV